MKKYVVGFSLLLSLSSCNYSQSKSMPLDSVDSGLSSEQVDFKGEISQI